MSEIEARGEAQWLAVIGRSLAYICLHLAELRDKELTTQGTFLGILGLGVKDSAALIGTTEESLAELLRQAKKRKGKGGRGGRKKKAKANKKAN